MLHSFSITPDESVLLIVDIQERLSKVMDQKILRQVTGQVNLLATLASETGIPILLTEQYPEGLGPTIGPVKNILKDKKHDSLAKLTFGCCDDQSFNQRIKTYGRKKIIVTGMETHVCIYLTALGLLGQSLQPFVPADAVISREKFYYKNGLELMRQAGTIITNTETLIFQLMVQSGTSLFKKMSALLKENLSKK